MSSANVNKAHPISYQEQETLDEAGAKAAMRCSLALGSTVLWRLQKDESTEN